MKRIQVASILIVLLTGLFVAAGVLAKAGPSKSCGTDPGTCQQGAWQGNGAHPECPAQGRAGKDGSCSLKSGARARGDTATAGDIETCPSDPTQVCVVVPPAIEAECMAD